MFSALCYHFRYFYVGLSDQLNHSNYWGTRQQLLAGKIIADYIDPDYGPLDPIFGVLLCPVAGEYLFEDSSIQHSAIPLTLSGPGDTWPAAYCLA